MNDPTTDELTCPVTGECIDCTSIDAVADALERINGEIQRLRIESYKLRDRLVQMDATADADVVTRRLQGQRRRVRIELPDLFFSQPVLKQIVTQFPEGMWRGYLHVGAWKVDVKEFKKLRSMTGDTPFFNSFRDRLLAACEGRKGLPTVIVEPAPVEPVVEQYPAPEPPWQDE